jgi:hypothetical protein
MTRGGNGSGRTITRPRTKRLRIETRTHTHTHTCRVLGGYQVPVGFDNYKQKQQQQLVVDHENKLVPNDLIVIRNQGVDN